MDIRHLTSFVHIAKSKSFTKTAENLGYVQSSVSAHISALEKELGAKLFQRNLGKSITLTPEGARLLPIAEEIVSLSIKMLSSVKPKHETLSVATIESLRNSRQKYLFQRYHSNYPDINLIMQYGNCSDNRSLLREGKVDIAILLDQNIVSDEFEVQFYYEECLSLFVAPNHALAKRKVVKPSDLNNMELILTEKGCSYHDLFINYIRENSITPRRIVETNSIAAITELVHNCAGITLLPDVAVTQEVADGMLIPLNWGGSSFNMFSQYAIRRNGSVSRKVKLFLDMSKSL